VGIVDLFDSTAHAVDIFLGLWSPAQWDAWRNWIVAIGGLVALALATATYLRNGKLKNSQVLHHRFA
jgi:hypothetical protein